MPPVLIWCDTRTAVNTNILLFLPRLCKHQPYNTHDGVISLTATTAVHRDRREQTGDRWAGPPDVLDSRVVLPRAGDVRVVDDRGSSRRWRRQRLVNCRAFPRGRRRGRTSGRVEAAKLRPTPSPQHLIAPK